MSLILKNFFAKFLFMLILGHSIVYSNHISLLKDDGESIELLLKSPKIEFADVNVRGELFKKIIVDAASYSSKKGEPELPFFTEHLMLSNYSDVQLEIISEKTRVINVGKIISSKGIIKRSENPSLIPYTFGSVYDKLDNYPKNSVQLSSPYIQRDVRGTVLSFYPFQYNPSNQTLIIWDEVKIKIIEKNRNAHNRKNAAIKKISPSFNKLYEKRFLNYRNRSTRLSRVNDGDKMVIITDSNYKSAVLKLAEWKNQKGIETVVYTFGSETGGSSASALETFIKNQYNQNDITYFLIVGDFEDIPSPREYENSDSREKLCSKDPVLTLIKGNDRYQDAFIGRFSVSSQNEAEIVVNKNIWYEKTPEENGAWYKKCLGIASSDGSWSGAKDYERMDWLRDSLMSPEYNYSTWTDVYDPGAYSSDVKNALEYGRGLTLYIGHGASSKFVTSGFGTNHVGSLNNSNLPTAIFSVACSNGHFSGKTCFAEAMQRAGSETSPRGSIVFLGATIDISWLPPCDGLFEMVSLIKQDEYISIGAIISNGLSEMVSKNSYDNTYKYWHTFGDPSLCLYTDSPTKFSNVNTPSSLVTGDQNISINYDEPIDGRVCLWDEDNGILENKMVEVSDGSGIDLDVTIPHGVKSVKLTITGRNKVPYIKDINVGSTDLKDSKPELETSLQKLSITSQKMSFSIPKDGDYLITLYSLDGSSVYTKNLKLAKGLQSINWNGNYIGKGIFIISIKSKYSNLKEKIVLR